MGSVLASVLIAHMLIPIWAARQRSLRRALVTAFVAATLFDVAYLLVLYFVQMKMSAGILDVLNSGIM